MEYQNQREQSLKGKLEAVVDNLTHSETVTLETVMGLIGREGLLFFCIFLTLPFMVPVSIPGVSTVFGLSIILIGIGLLSKRNPWLPGSIMKKSFPAATLALSLQKGLVWVQRIEKISRPRLPALTRGETMNSVNGFVLLVGGVLLTAPFGFVPFSNTLPGLAILFLALGMLQQDGWCILLAYATTGLTIIYFAFLLLGGTLAIQKILGMMGS